MACVGWAGVSGDPGWRVFQQDGLLLATAGTDEVWLIDDVPGHVADELAACWSDDPPVPSALSPEALMAVGQLRSLGAVRAAVGLEGGFSVGVSTVGEPAANLAEALGGLRGLVDASAADVVVFVRAGVSLQEYGAASAELVRRGVVHLAVDLAADHTVSLGPLVVPGHSGCVGCLVARVVWRWGDLVPPARPRAADASGALVVAGLVERQLQLLGSGVFELADRTVSIDLATLVSSSSPCLRTARCLLCADVLSDGRLALPWLS